LYWKFTNDLDHTISDTKRIESLAKKMEGMMGTITETTKTQRHKGGAARSAFVSLCLCGS
jgi:hypothetical protein